MSLPNNIASVLDVLMALTQSSLWVIVMAKGVRHSGVALHGHIVASCFEQFAVLMRLVPAEVEFCRDDVCTRHTFEGFREDGRGHPVSQRRPTQFCEEVSISIFVSFITVGADLCPSVSSDP